MQGVAVIAANAVRELVRSKLLYNLLIFAVLLIAGSFGVAQLTIGNWDRIILDMGLGAIEVVGVLVAVLIGVNVVAGEIERKTIYATLAKPIGRGAFVVGRYVGLLAILAVNVVLMLGALALVLNFANHGLSRTALLAAGLLFVELALMAAVAVFFSSFTTPILGAAFSFCVFPIGHLLGDLRTFGDRSKNEALRLVMNGLYRVLPDLELLNLKAQAANRLEVDTGGALAAGGYGLGYALVMVALAVLFFQRRDLK